MRIHLTGRYTIDEFANMMAKVLPTLTDGQIGCLENIDIRFTALDLDGRETYPSDVQGRHAGLSIMGQGTNNSGVITTDWHFPWLRGHEWPEDRS